MWRRRTQRRLAAWALAAVGLTILACRDATSQERASRPVFFPIESEHDVLWRQVEKARERGDSTALLEGLTRVAEIILSPAVNSVIEIGDGLAIGLRVRFRDFVAALSPADMESFAPRVNPLVAALWAQSQARGDAEELRTVRRLLVRDFPFAEVYAECLHEEIDFALERGDWHETLRLAEEIARVAALDRGAAGSFDVEARARLLAAQAAAAAGEGAARARQELETMAAGDRWGDADPGLVREVQRLLSARPGATDAPVEPVLEASIGSFTAGLIAGADGKARFRLGGIVWEERLPRTRLRAYLDERSRHSPAGHAPTPFHPAARDGLVVFEHEDVVLAYDLARGRKRWEVAPPAPRSGFAVPRMPLVTPESVYLAEGAVLAALDVNDGSTRWSREAVYDRVAKTLAWIDPDTESRPQPEPEAPEEPETVEPAEPAGENEGDKDADKDNGEGNPGKRPAGRAKARKAKSNVTGSGSRAVHSLSAPARLGAHVATAATVRIGQETQTHLVVFRNDGEVEWSAYLGSSQGGNYLGLASAGSIPLADDGRVYLLTSAGTVASLDARDGAILWVRAYTPLSVRAKREAARSENRWHPNPLLVVGDQIIAAPQDAAMLISLDRRTGETLWQAPRESRSTLLGATERACLVAGTGVAAIAHSGDDRGHTLWRSDPEDARLAVAGRAALTPGAVLLPTRESLVAVSPDDGKVLGRTHWEESGGGGNLLWMERLPPPDNAAAGRNDGQALAVAGPSGLYIYNTLERNRARVEALPKDSTESFLEAAKLHLRNREISPALERLRAWQESAPPNPQPNSPLDHLQLELAELIRELGPNAAAGEQVLELLRFRGYLERIPKRKIEAAIILADSLAAAKAWSDALGTLHEALQFDNPATLYSPDGVLSVPSADILRDRILSLRRRPEVPPETFARIESMARDALRRAQNKLKTPIGFREVTRLYPFTPAAAEAYFDLARIYLDAQAYDQAALALDGYVQDFPGGRDVVRARLLAANLVRQSGRSREARDRYTRILADHSASLVQGIDGARPGETVEAYVRPLLQDPSLAEHAAQESPELKFPVRMAWRSPADLASPKRTLIRAAGPPPEELRRSFLTQSEDVIELRSIDTGLPVWKTHLELIPGFEFDDPGLGRNFRLPRTGRRAFQGRFVPLAEGPGQGQMLVLNDERNVFALEPRRGSIRWHIPIGPENEARLKEEPFRLHLREKLRGVSSGPQEIYALTTRGRLLRVSLKGEIDWEVKLPYPTWLHPPIVRDDALYVISQPFSLHAHDLATGKELTDAALADAVAELGQEAWRPALEVGGKLFLTSGEKLALFDLSQKRVAWEYRKSGRIEEVFHFPEAPGECIVACRSRANNWPSLACVAIDGGTELWRFEKFRPTASTSLYLARDGNRFYVLLAGQESGSKLLGIQVREGTAGEPAAAEALWPSEQALGGTFGYVPGRLQVSDDSLFFLESDNSLRVFDKWSGEPRSAAASVIERFLLEKDDSTCAVVQGKLLILTDGGDCAFESAPSSIGEGATDAVSLLQQFLAHPGQVEDCTQLALHYFRAGETLSAIELLNRSLASEEILEERGAEKRFALSYLLDGFKEEYMKTEVPGIATRRAAVPPAIDGDLGDPWDVATRVVLASPRHVGTIPGPDQHRDWEGEEDLSAILYTGWDDKYFYFALDVSDDVLHPFDRDSENWKGDCLVIGLDPTNDQGYRQHGDDQLMTLALTVPRRNKVKKPDGEEEEEEADEEEERRRPKGLFQVKKKDDDSGAIYEVALPWHEYFGATLGDAAPPPGYTFGLSLLVTDDDKGQGATKTLSLNPCHLLPRNQRSIPAYRFIVPYFFPKVTLE